MNNKLLSIMLGLSIALTGCTTFQKGEPVQNAMTVINTGSLSWSAYVSISKGQCADAACMEELELKDQKAKVIIESARYLVKGVAAAIKAGDKVKAEKDLAALVDLVNQLSPEHFQTAFYLIDQIRTIIEAM